jgi:hypothetical protein
MSCYCQHWVLIIFPLFSVVDINEKKFQLTALNLLILLLPPANRNTLKVSLCISNNVKRSMLAVIVCILIDWFDWLIIYCFTSHWRIFHSYGDITIDGEGLQNLCLCPALRTSKLEGIFILPHLLWHGTSAFPVSSEWPLHSVALTTHMGM